MAAGDGSDLGTVLARLAGGDPPSMEARRVADELLPGRLADGDRVVGLGWATVDTERAIADATEALLDATFRLAWELPTREAAVGATALVTRIGDVVLAVLEPDTEARLAAFLARFGEGPCLAYVAGEGPGGMVRATALGVPGHLRAHEHPWGPYLIVVPGPPSAQASEPRSPPR